MSVMLLTCQFCGTCDFGTCEDGQYVLICDYCGSKTSLKIDKISVCNKILELIKKGDEERARDMTIRLSDRWPE